MNGSYLADGQKRSDTLTTGFKVLRAAVGRGVPEGRAQTPDDGMLKASVVAYICHFNTGRCRRNHHGCDSCLALQVGSRAGLWREATT